MAASPLVVDGLVVQELSREALYELRRRKGRYAIVTMCVGGGMGIATIIERI
mgnify:CR=1 FL=1